MKSLFFLSLLTLGMSAQAAIITLPIFEYHSTNGYVAPQNQVETYCDFSDDGNMVSEVTYVANKPAPVSKKPVLWSASVPNAKIALDLLEKASHGITTTGLQQVGGPTESYVGYYSDTIVVDLLERGGLNIANTSPEAKTLVEFIDLNCKR